MWYRADRNAYQIVSGERRYRAAVAAGLSAVPCIVEEPPAGQKQLERKTILVDQIVENWQRTDLNAYELSDALVELRDKHGYAQKDLAEVLAKPESEISRLLSLQRIEPALQKDLRGDVSGTFSRRHMIAVAQVPAGEQKKVADRVKAGGLTAVETERLVAKKRTLNTGRPAPKLAGALWRYAVGTATVQVRFRKREASNADVLNVLRKVIKIVEARLRNE